MPFLDLELMRFVERIPARVRVRGIKRKWLYRKALRGGPAGGARSPEAAFSTPYDDWFRSSLGRRSTAVYAPGARSPSTSTRPTVRRLCDEHRSGRADHKRILYCLLEFAYWHRAFIEGA